MPTNPIIGSFAFHDASSVGTGATGDSMPPLQSISQSRVVSNASSDFDISNHGMDVYSPSMSLPPCRACGVTIKEVLDNDENDDIKEIPHCEEIRRTPSPKVEIIKLTDKQELGKSSLNIKNIVLPIFSEKLKKGFHSPIYTFYRPKIEIKYCCSRTSKKSQKHHVFVCAAPGCKHCVARNQETRDQSLSSNLKDHARQCWGINTVKAALQVKDLDQAQVILKKHGRKKNGLLTTVFLKLKKLGANVYSMIPLTKAEV